MTTEKHRNMAGRTVPREKRPARIETVWSRRDQAEQAVAMWGPDEAIRKGWPAEEIWQAMQRMQAAVGDDEPELTTLTAAKAETAARYSGTTREYHHHGGGVA